MKQQEQTKNYFNSHATAWNEQAKQLSYNTIVDRNSAVIDSLRAHGSVKNFLDVGCGTGQLTIEVASTGATATGIDFAPEMIKICKEAAGASKSTAKFVQSSVFDFSPDFNSFDLISAQGFIEYISERELEIFIKFVGETLRSNGIAVIGSRNRLFNIFSLNEYTKLEESLGTSSNLILESTLIQLAKSQESLFDELERQDFHSKQPVSHPNTGIEVTTRFQYSPSELIRKFKKADLYPIKIYPVNFQPIPQSLLTETAWSNVKDQLANQVSHLPLRPHQLVPFSSSFVLAVKKN